MHLAKHTLADHMSRDGPEANNSIDAPVEPNSLTIHAAKIVAKQVTPQNWYGIAPHLRIEIVSMLTIKQYVDIFGWLKLGPDICGDYMHIYQVVCRGNVQYTARSYISINGLINDDTPLFITNTCPFADNPTWMLSRLNTTVLSASIAKLLHQHSILLDFMRCYKDWISCLSLKGEINQPGIWHTCYRYRENNKICRVDFYPENQCVYHLDNTRNVRKAITADMCITYSKGMISTIKYRHSFRLHGKSPHKLYYKGSQLISVKYVPHWTCLAHITYNECWISSMISSTSRYGKTRFIGRRRSGKKRKPANIPSDVFIMGIKYLRDGEFRTYWHYGICILAKIYQRDKHATYLNHNAFNKDPKLLPDDIIVTLKQANAHHMRMSPHIEPILRLL